MIYIRTLWAFANLVVVTIITGSSIVVIALLLRKQTLITGLLRFWGSWVIKAAGIKVKLHGLENIKAHWIYS